jgi:hypothetical protein
LVRFEKNVYDTYRILEHVTEMEAGVKRGFICDLSGLNAEREMLQVIKDLAIKNFNKGPRGQKSGWLILNKGLNLKKVSREKECGENTFSDLSPRLRKV